jgi:Predicted RNA-binding protein containing KH domain, possibly ribosomal protein
MTKPAPSLGQLKARAQKLKALIHLGHDGITDALTAALDQALADHGLVKVRFTDHKSERKALAAALTARTRARLVLQVGHTVTLYRTPLDPPAAG